MRKITYKPEKCVCCGQTMTYIFALSKGGVDTMKQIARAIEEKGINYFHARKELENRWLTSSQVANLSNLRSHGLIAKIKGKAGNYCLTKKGGQFLNGLRIPRYAIISKATKHQIGYFEPERETISVSDCNSKDEYWQGVGFEIEEGDIIKINPQKKLLA